MKAYDAKREESPPGTIVHLEASMGRLRYSLGLASTCVWTFVGFTGLNATDNDPAMSHDASIVARRIAFSHFNKR